MSVQKHSLKDLRKEKRLLLVSSDQRLVSVSTKFYKRRGYLIRGETSSKGALTAVSDFRPQVVLLDVDINKIGGMRLLNDLKKIDQDCNVLLFTENEEPEVVKEAWRNRAFFFLKRGDSATKIRQEIERAYEDYFDRQELKHLHRFVFVLMPFSKDFQDVYFLGVKEAVKEAGLFCERIDEQHFTESILETIFQNIRKARFIVAEMTGRNPNVFYEVGYAHAIGKPVIFLARDSSEIPFDLKDKPHIIYGESIINLKEQLRERLRALIEKGVGIH